MTPQELAEGLRLAEIEINPAIDESTWEDCSFIAWATPQRIKELILAARERDHCKHPRCCCVCGHTGKCPECGPSLIDESITD